MPIFVKLLVLQAETAAGLCGLKDGGSFVIKIFTFFQSQSTSFLYLLTNLFEFVDVFKPATSKEGNSEVYVVCQAFRRARLTTEVKKILLELASRTDGGRCNSGLFFHSFEEVFAKEVVDCAKFFMDLQSNVIKRNLKTYDQGVALGWDRMRRQVADEFMVRNRIRGIRRGAKIVPFSAKTNPLQVDKRVEPESFSSRLERPSDLNGQYQSLCVALQKLNRMTHFKFKRVEWLQLPNLRSHELRLRRGKKLEAVLSSKFCSSLVVNLFNEVKNLVAEQMSSLKNTTDDDASSDEDEVNPSKRLKIEKDDGVVVTMDDLPTEYSERVMEHLEDDVAKHARVLRFKVENSHEYLDSCLCSRKALAEVYLKEGSDLF